MPFTDFTQSIASANLKAVAEHWNLARGEKPMPFWSDIRPSSIAKQLSMVWCYVYDAEQDEFVGRLGGETISQIFGRPIRGIKLSELAPVVGLEKMKSRFKRVLQEPALVSGYGAMFTQLDRYGVGERIVMPLATEDGHPNAVFGATEYRIHGLIPSEMSKVVDRETWFSLND
jgi:hypothetical protein